MFKGSTYRLARLLLLLTAAIVGTTLSVVYRQWMLLLLAVPALIFLFSALFRLHFQNIRKMTFMFNSIENGDYSFKFTEYDAPVSDNLLNLTLNRIKDLLVKAKNEVIDKERYYELILNSVHTGVIVLNETGNVYQINNEARRLIGLPRFTHINQLATIDRSLQELFFAIRGGERRLPTRTSAVRSIWRSTRRKSRSGGRGCAFWRSTTSTTSSTSGRPSRGFA